jgi:hypothetical protein
MAGQRARGGREQLAGSGCGVGCNGEGRLDNLIAATAADEVRVVTDTYEHAARLQSYQRVAEMAAKLEVKPIAAGG